MLADGLLDGLRENREEYLWQGTGKRVCHLPGIHPVWEAIERVNRMSRSMRRVALIAALAASLYSCRPVKQTIYPTAIAELNLDVSRSNAIGSTIGFVFEDLIAIGHRETVFFGKLTAVQWRGERLSILKARQIADYRGSGGLFPADGERFISSLKQPPELLSADSSQITEIPTKVIIPPVGGGHVAGDSHGFEHWDIYRLAPARIPLRQGAGELLSLSDDLMVVRSNDEIRIEKLTGEPLGSFAVPPLSACYAKALLLGPDRLYLDGCGQGRVVNFSGKTILNLPEPDGWGSRYGLTKDGHRMLFDRYTRRISFLDRMAESVESAITFGMAPVVVSKGEIIRVVDTATGKVCFDLDSPDRLFGRAGEYHADISPSGRFIAVVSANKLSIYRMPNVCHN